ncbi:MAG: uroporphyrinogen-III C-methyltransferase [Tepidiformaceae bacterium]
MIEDAAADTPVGRVAIVGAGPGDPGLLTVAGAQAIAGADVVLYDALSSPAVLRGAKSGAELVYVGKRSGRQALPQAEINALVIERARAGATVVRLKGGDPFVFGRGGEEAMALRAAGIQFSVVPGITSAIAAPAYAGIPVTHRGLAAGFMVITGNESGEEGSAGVDWEAAARAGTLVILMGVASLAASMERLRGAGLAADTPAACIRWGTRPDQRVLHGTVGDIADNAAAAGLTSPVVTVVGAVAALGKELAWFEAGPLAGKRVVVTRARAQVSELTAKLESLGAYVIEAPAIVVARRDDANLRHAITRQWDWVVFASANGVEAAFESLWAAGRDARWLSGTRMAAIGAATAAALAARGVRADFVPATATADAMATGLPMVAGQRILLPVSALTDGRLAAALRDRGGTIDQVVAYDNHVSPLDEERRREVTEAHVVTFTSASTARHLREALGETALPASAKLVSIGPQTSAAVVAAFGRVDREARAPGLDALVEAVMEALPWD